ncbi:cysteine desulfurase family protein [Albibacterium profundi]|uniref:cysteine desulfurase n=1 Tax=Albibacterium profundi TaxID=3134906 RepID=A0ABV5CFT9_9SPHI
MKNTTTYLDYNATTPVDPRVIESVNLYFNEFYGNASSLHSLGNKSKTAVDTAKSSVATLLDTESDNIYFTSGATESINFALKGLALHPNNSKKHIITCHTEHKAVLETCKYLRSVGYEIEFLPVNKDGSINLNLLKSSIKANTLLVCLMWVNNETGVIHPVKEIGKITRDAGIYFVCDGTQGVGKLPINVMEAEIDILCFSGHKMYAPKGIGGIYINRSITKENKILPLIHGGGQEDGLRNGTYNVPLIAGLGKACEIAREEVSENEEYIKQLQDFIEDELLQIKGAYIHGKSTPRIYNTINVCIPGLDTEIFIGMNNDIAVSNGSACSSALVQPSHVLLAMDINADDAQSSLRISMGKNSTKEDLELLIQRLKNFILIS